MGLLHVRYRRSWTGAAGPLLSFELPPAMSDVQRLPLLVVATLPNHCRSCWIRLCWHVPQALLERYGLNPTQLEASISSDHQGPALALSSLAITSVASLNSQLGAAAEGSALVGPQPPLPACSKFLPEVRTPTKRPKAEAVLPLLRRKARPSPVARD